MFKKTKVNHRFFQNVISFRDGCYVSKLRSTTKSRVYGVAPAAQLKWWSAIADPVCIICGDLKANVGFHASCFKQVASSSLNSSLARLVFVMILLNLNSEIRVSCWHNSYSD